MAILSFPNGQLFSSETLKLHFAKVPIWQQSWLRSRESNLIFALNTTVIPVRKNITFIAVLVFGIHSRRKGKVLDVLELPKSTLTRIINLEKRYYEKNGQYVSFPMGVSCKPIRFDQPSWDTDGFDYSFLPRRLTMVQIPPDSHRLNRLGA